MKDDVVKGGKKQKSNGTTCVTTFPHGKLCVVEVCW